MACQCNCCKGACCYDFAGTPTCSFNTCEECEAVNGEFQGIGTECGSGDECPCDPPADGAQCERCSGGSPVSRCKENQHCCDGVCQDDPCDPPECEADEDCPCVGPEDPYFCPDEDDCCGPLGLVAAGTYGGDAVCCPEGWTFDESSLACFPPDGQSDCYCCDGECQAEPCPP